MDETGNSGASGVEFRAEKGEARSYLDYIGGPSHVHTNESEDGVLSTLSLGELLSYVREKVDNGTGKVDMMVVTDHSEHISSVENIELLRTEGLLSEEDALLAVEAKKRGQGQQQKESSEADQALLMKIQSLVLEKQIAEIETINAQNKKPHIYSGVETSIMGPDGSLTLPDDILAKLDVVIASIHPDFLGTSDGGRVPLYENSVKGLTDFYLKALENSNIDVIGHPIKGNMVEINDELKAHLAEQGNLESDLGSLMEKMAQKQVAFEINMKDPIYGMAESKANSVFEEVVRLAEAHGTPLTVGIDWHLFQHWQHFETIAKSLDESELVAVEETADKPGTLEQMQRSEGIRKQFGIGVKFWLRLVRICKMLDKYNIPKEQVVNSSNQVMSNWIERRKQL